MVDLNKLKSYKGAFTREGLVKLSQAALYKLAYELEMEGDLPEDKNKLMTAILKQYNTLKITSEDNSDVKLPPEETGEAKGIEGPLSPEDEALVTGQGTKDGAVIGDGINLTGALEEEGQFTETIKVDPKDVAYLNAALLQTTVVQATLIRLARIEQKLGFVKASGTLHGHVDDLKHG